MTISPIDNRQSRYRRSPRHVRVQYNYRTNNHELGVLVRQSFESSNKNYLQIDWTFPLWGNIRGYAQFLNGYGESLIDYNAKIERFGLGILLSDLL